MNAKEQILTSILQCERKDLYASRFSLTDKEQALFDEKIKRLNGGEPLQYIIGDVDFMGYQLNVNEAVLIPRPETEIMVDYALNWITRSGISQARICDLGTGSGNIAIALAYHQIVKSVVAVDISSAALTVAQANAKKHGLYDKIYFQCADMLTFLRDEPGVQEFDVLISNPPYIPECQLQGLPQEVQKEPQLALNGGITGLDFLNGIIDNAPAFLSVGGLLICEFADGQEFDLENRLQAAKHYTHIEFHKDYTQTPRFFSARRQ